MAWIKNALRPPYRRFRGELERRRLRSIIAAARPLRVVVGAGGICEPGWIPTDIDVLDLSSLGDWRMLFAFDSIDAILAEHVWEHLTPQAGAVAAANCHRFLKVGGYARVAVPDGFHPDPAYIERVRPGGSGPGAGDHQVLYTFETFRRVFEAVGFEVTLLEYFDADGRFHYREWDPADGLIHRSKRFDERNAPGSLLYTSIVLDARRSRTIG